MATKQDLKELEYRLIIKLGAVITTVVTAVVGIGIAILKTTA